MAENITVMTGESPYDDARIIFPEPSASTRDNAWLTVDLGNDRPKYSLNLIRTDEGIVVDIYFLDHEDFGEPVATTYAFDNDLKGN